MNFVLYTYLNCIHNILINIVFISIQSFNTNNLIKRQVFLLRKTFTIFFNYYYEQFNFVFVKNERIKSNNTFLIFNSTKIQQNNNFKKFSKFKIQKNMTNFLSKSISLDKNIIQKFNNQKTKEINNFEFDNIEKRLCNVNQFFKFFFDFDNVFKEINNNAF